MARLRWVALAVTATIALSACTGGVKARSTAEGKIAGTTGPAGAKTTDDLGKRLDITVPAGYVVQPDDRDDTGPSDLEKAVNDDGGDDARDLFTRDRFVRGYQREWALDDDDQIVSYVYQFADQAGADDYTKRVTTDAGSAVDGVTTTTFSVPDIAGAVGVTGSDGSFSTATVTFVKGPYSVQLMVTSTKADGLQSLVTSLASEQSSKL